MERPSAGSLIRHVVAAAMAGRRVEAEAARRDLDVKPVNSFGGAADQDCAARQIAFIAGPPWGASRSTLTATSQRQAAPLSSAKEPGTRVPASRGRRVRRRSNP